MEKLNVPNVFVVHVKKGFEERRAFIEKQLASHNIPFEFMLDGDLPDLTQEIVDNYFTGEIMNNISCTATSCALKHLYIYEQIVKRNIPYALILEDDAVLTPNFNTIFNQSLDELKTYSQKEQDRMFISYEDTTLCFVKKEEIEEGKLLYPANKGRCTGAYLVTYSVAKLILEYVAEHKCHLPIDGFHNFLVQESNLFDIYWCHPAIVQQGSHNGKFTSALSHKKGTLYQKIRWKVKAYWKRRINRG